VHCRAASLRLAGHDYADTGAYFVTICTHRRECLFGRIVNGDVQLNDLGRIVVNEWARSASIRPEIDLDAFVVMPNHLHGIVVIDATVGTTGRVGAHGRAPLQRRTPRSLGSFVAGFKSATTTHVNALRGTPRAPLWQRNYHDRVIRDENELARIRTYINDNPLRWPDNENNLAIRQLMTPLEVPRRKIGFGNGDR
jgi:putative transposase